MSDKKVGDAKAEVEQAMRSRMDDIADLTQVATGEGDELDLSEHGVDAGEGWERQEQAQERLRELPLAVEKTVTFEIVLGTGGPDDRIIVECDVIDGRVTGAISGSDQPRYEIRRVLYRYSWTGSAEVELTGDDREVAEAFAREVVAELIE